MIRKIVEYEKSERRVAAKTGPSITEKSENI